MLTIRFPEQVKDKEMVIVGIRSAIPFLLASGERKQAQSPGLVEKDSW